MGIHSEEGGLTFARIEKNAPVLRPAIQLKHRCRNRGGGEPNDQIVSVKRAAEGRRQRSKKNIDEKRQKYKAKNGFLRNTSTGSKGEIFVILKNHANAPVRKKRLSPTSKARREAS